MENISSGNLRNIVISGWISLCGLIFISVYNYMYISKLPYQDFFGYLFGGLYIIIFIFHILVAAYLVRNHDWLASMHKHWKSVLIFTIISFIALVGEKVRYDEIGRQIGAGLEYGNELLFLLFQILINIFFTITAIFFFMELVYIIRKDQP